MSVWVLMDVNISVAYPHDHRADRELWLLFPKITRQDCPLTASFAAAAAKLLQSCLTLCDPIDGSPPGSSVHRILQARVLEWVAIPFSRGSSKPIDQTWVS